MCHQPRTDAASYIAFAITTWATNFFAMRTLALLVAALLSAQVCMAQMPRDQYPPDSGTRSYIPSSAESPAVAAAIADNDPEALAKALHEERLDNPAGPLPVNLSGKLAKFKGKASLLLFFVPCAKEALAGTGNTQEALDQLQKVADSELCKKSKINVAVITPATPEEIKEYFADHGNKLPVIYDPEDTIRKALGLYSLPMLLLDTQGNIVWRTRMGERNQPAAGEPADYSQSDLEAVVTRVASGKYSAKTEPAPIAGARTNEAPVFDFEEPLEGWTLLGDCWGTDGQTSENRYPGLVKGFHGRKWLSSFAGPASAGTGIAVSPEFTVNQRYLHLVVGGGDLHMKAGVALVCDGTTVKTATGKNSYEMAPVAWDLKPWIGKKARIIAYDAGKIEMRDGIMLDAVTASDSPQTPAAFKDLHDPNNSAHAARVAADIPEDYKAIQDGNFHISSTPGKTFEIEWSWKVKIAEGARNFYDEGLTFPNTVGQTIHKQGFQLEAGGRTFQSKMLPTGKAVCTEVKALEIPLNQAGKNPFHRDKTTLTVNVLKLERGPSTDFQPLPEKMRKALTAPTADGYDYEHPIIKKILDKDGMRRWPAETDPAYLLRLWRYVQRYWTGNGGKWDGYPITSTAPYGVYNFEQKSLACPTSADMATALRAAGIPALEGQGWWLSEDGGECTGHVRALVFLDKVGWILIDDAKGLDRPFGPYTFGNTWGDNYAQILWDESPAYPKRTKWPTAGMDVTPDAPHGSFKSRPLDE